MASFVAAAVLLLLQLSVVPVLSASETGVRYLDVDLAHAEGVLSPKTGLPKGALEFMNEIPPVHQDLVDSFLQDEFASFDKNSDGFLDEDDDAPPESISAADNNADGKINATEYMDHVTAQFTEQYGIEFLFKELDVNGNGFFEDDEGKTFGGVLIHDPAEILLRMDSDGDGKVSYEEFMTRQMFQYMIGKKLTEETESLEEYKQEMAKKAGDTDEDTDEAPEDTDAEGDKSDAEDEVEGKGEL